MKTKFCNKNHWCDFNCEHCVFVAVLSTAHVKLIYFYNMLYGSERETTHCASKKMYEKNKIKINRKILMSVLGFILNVHPLTSLNP